MSYKTPETEAEYRTRLIQADLTMLQVAVFLGEIHDEGGKGNPSPTTIQSLSEKAQGIILDYFENKGETDEKEKET